MKFIKSTLAILSIGVMAISCTSHQSCAAYSSNQQIEKNSNEIHVNAIEVENENM